MPSSEDLEDLAVSADVGGRSIAGLTGKLIVFVALSWSLFQLWIASPLPYVTHFAVLNATESRAIHLAFALLLAFLSFTASTGTSRERVPKSDWLFAIVGALCAGYIFVFFDELAFRSGRTTTADLIISGLGLILLLEATRRAVGIPLTVVAIIFLSYVFFGHLAPEAISWRGASFSRAMSHMWLTAEGVFGVALGVSTSFVFLFVLFGALLQKAGGGNYFIRIAFALLGHLRGGPAKAAVIASGLLGLISGSSIANVMTTGTLTIPLMRRVGFSAQKAGAIEVAASVNGQILPPVMGAAAFLMVEFVGIPYAEVIKHAFLPAVISYIALLYIVHLEAMKSNIQGIESHKTRKFNHILLYTGITISSIIIFSSIIYFSVWWLKYIFASNATWIIILLTGLLYVFLVKYSSLNIDLESENKNQPFDKLPEALPTLKSGLHYILPVVILIWCLMIERFSPALSVFWANVFLIFILFTQKSLYAFFSSTGDVRNSLHSGLLDVADGLIQGARNMVPVAIAVSAAGIIVGTTTLTGIGLIVTDLVEMVSGGNIIIMLVMVAVICVILGMGLPTTANYIVVASLMAGVVVEQGAQNGLIVPLIAVHMFVFYFGLLADATPPVGLGSYAAAAISGANPLKTCLSASAYELRTAALPFMFIFNTKLLLIGITGIFDLFVTVTTATLAMLVFAAATQGYFFVRSRLYESVLLLVVAFSLFRPGFWMDMVIPPFQYIDSQAIAEVAGNATDNGMIRMSIEGETFEGVSVSKQIILPLGPVGSGTDRIESSGLMLQSIAGKMVVEEVAFGSPASKAGIDIGFEIKNLIVDNDRPAKEWIFIPVLFVLSLVTYVQMRRRRRTGSLH